MSIIAIWQRMSGRSGLAYAAKSYHPQRRVLQEFSYETERQEQRKGIPVSSIRSEKG
jgi:hypothetical protein